MLGDSSGFEREPGPGECPNREVTELVSASRPIANALIYLATEVESEIEKDFNRWAEGHLKDNLTLRGFLSARRLRRHPSDSQSSDRGSDDGASQPTYLTLYDLAELEAIEELANPSRDRSMPEAFSGRFQFSRSLFRALGAAPDTANRQPRGPAVLHITVDVEAAHNEAFLEWYVGEHVPAVLSAPGVLSARRFENASLDVDGNPANGEFRYLTLYEMEDVGVVSRPETIEAAARAAGPAELESHRRFTHQVYEEFLTMEA